MWLSSTMAQQSQLYSLQIEYKSEVVIVKQWIVISTRPIISMATLGDQLRIVEIKKLVGGPRSLLISG